MTEERTSSLEGLTKDDILNKIDEKIVSDHLISSALEGEIKFDDMMVSRLSSQLNTADKIGTLKVRLGINRYDYKVPSGVYAIGNPVMGAPMFVTCNYKLTVDLIRSSLDGYDCFLLILDTDGINVWCAAGKGSFSSRELIYQLHKYQVKKRLGVGSVYLPQLGASSMEPHLVRQYTGIKVHYGPVDGRDLPVFIDKGFKATKEMRTVTFDLKERMILTPLEMILYFKYAVVFMGFSLFLSLISFLLGNEVSMALLVSSAQISLSGLVLSTIIFPLMLPIMPFKSFSYNGYLLGLILLIPIFYKPLFPLISLNIAMAIGMMVMMGYITFNFTGTTPFTSQSGVELEASRFKKEVKGGMSVSLLLLLLEVLF